MKMNAREMEKLLCAVLAAAMLLGMTGALAYADAGAMPPPLTEEVQPQITEPAPEGEGSLTYPVDEPVADEPTMDEPTVDGPVIDEPAADVPVIDEPVIDEPLAVPPMEGAPLEGTEWQETFVQTGEQTVEEAFAPTSATEEPTDQQPEQTDSGFGWDDPLYIKRVSTPMTIASIPAAYDAVRPRALRSGETLRKGVDVSEFQKSNIDWSAVASSGVEFAIVRVGYRGVKEGGLATDAYYIRNLTGARAAGLKVGAYFFSQAITPDEAREEARYLINAVKNYGIDLPLVFDYEEVTSANRRLVMADLDRQTKTDICNAFCQEVEAAGYQSMVYCNPTMLNRDVYRDSLGRLWLAHWTDQTDYASAYEFWQFGLGYVNGIPTDVDLDYWFDPDTVAIPPLAGQGAVTPATPTPAPTATPTPTQEPETAVPPQTGTPFTDVKTTSWYAQSVLWAYEKGIVDGMGDGTFAPGKTATRGQMAAMLYRFMGKPAVTGTAPFTDLKADYYKDAVNWASASKIVNGTSATTFGPNGQITREDLVTMLYRMAGSPAVSGSLSRFSDAGSVHSYASSAMVWAVDKGLIQGYDNNTIQPGTAASRAEVCTLLMRYSSLV